MRGRTLARAICLSGAGLAVASCRKAGILDPHGPVSSAERLILFNATGIMLVVVVPVILMTLAVAWRYRASNKRAEYTPDWSYSGQLELVVWAIPAMTVILLAGVAWIGSHELDPAKALDSRDKPVHIDVVALDWKWLFIYEGRQVGTLNQLVVPVKTPLVFTITSATVMTAFFVPQLGSQIYAMPGMTTHLNLLADQPGDYPGLASHYSGDGFSDMRFTVHAVPAADYEAWLERTHEEHTVLDADNYGDLARASMNVAARTYGSVDATLFDHILRVSAPMMTQSPKDR